MTKKTLLLFLALWILSISQVTADVLVSSTFDNNDEGWIGNPGEGSIAYTASGGNPDGHIRVTDIGIGVPLGSGAIAPSAFTGDLTAANDGTLSVDMATFAGGGSTFDIFGTVRITGAGMEAFFDLATTAPGFSVWQTFTAPLTASAWDMSSADWLNILSNVTEIAISTDAFDGGDTIGIDNFTINSIGAPNPVPPGVCVKSLPNMGLLTVNHTGTDVCLTTPPANPVMLLGPPSFNGANPGVVQLNSKLPSVDYVVRFKEWDYLDGTHKNEVVSYLVLAEGHYNMPDGSIWEVGRFTLNGTANWRSVTFDRSFAGRPYLFLTAQTENGRQTVSVRARNVNAMGFQAAFFEEQFLMDGHASEGVGYLAIHHPTRTVTPEVNGLGGMTTIDGENVPYYAQRLSVDHRFKAAVGASLKVEEERSADFETSHAMEEIDVLAIGGQIFAQQVSSFGGDPTALRRNKRVKE